MFLLLLQLFWITWGAQVKSYINHIELVPKLAFYSWLEEWQNFANEYNVFGKCNLYLRFNRLLRSFQLYIVKFKKRPTKHWCLIQHGLKSFNQRFAVLTWNSYIKYEKWVGARPKWVPPEVEASKLTQTRMATVQKLLSLFCLNKSL